MRYELADHERVAVNRMLPNKPAKYRIAGQGSFSLAPDREPQIAA